MTCIVDMFVASLLLVTAALVAAGPATESFKDQFCTDPRTMKKYEPYVEWADEYSCTRHRCQPGGRNLAIYTVGCKRVEAPESAIECEEVVEDTNMQFPFCCTRLRCLVVVRGEVWTRVLGQPWEHLPAAPWSHMYKMKKPPPGATPFLSKSPEQGPVYELMDPEATNGRDKVLRAGKKTTTENPDCNDVIPRAAPAPDIVIALSTNSDQKEHKKGERKRHKRVHKSKESLNSMQEEGHDHELQEVEEALSFTEKPPELSSDERFNQNAHGVTPKAQFKSQHHQVAWTEIPQSQWSEHESMPDAEVNKENISPQEFPPPDPEKKEEKPNNLQALVDAIGTRMRDIENVVQRMSEKVHREKMPEEYSSAEKKSELDSHKRQKESKYSEYDNMKKPNPDGEHYKRFSVRNRGSKYLHGAVDGTTEQPLFIEDNNMNGYFSDASNSVLRRSNKPKEPAVTYMAPVPDTRRKPSSHIALTDSSVEEKKRKKHSHKKKRGKGHGHKKHHVKEDKRKRFTRLSSAESDKNAVSLEDSSAVANK